MKQAGHMLKRAISVQSNSDDDGRIYSWARVRKRKVMYIMCHVCTYGTMYGSVGSILFFRPSDPHISNLPWMPFLLHFLGLIFPLLSVQKDLLDQTSFPWHHATN